MPRHSTSKDKGRYRNSTITSFFRVRETPPSANPTRREREPSKSITSSSVEKKLFPASLPVLNGRIDSPNRQSQSPQSSPHKSTPQNTSPESETNSPSRPVKSPQSQSQPRSASPSPSSAKKATPLRSPSSKSPSILDSLLIKQESSPEGTPERPLKIETMNEPCESLLIDLSQDDDSDSSGGGGGNEVAMMIDLSNDGDAAGGKANEATIDLTQDEDEEPNSLLKNTNGVTTIDLTQDDDENDSSPTYGRKVSLTEEQSSSSNQPIIKDEQPESPARNLFSEAITNQSSLSSQPIIKEEQPESPACNLFPEAVAHSSPQRSPIRKDDLNPLLSQLSIPPDMDTLFKSVTKESPSPKKRQTSDSDSDISVADEQDTLDDRKKPPPFSPLIAERPPNPDSPPSVEFPLPVRGSICRVLCKTDDNFFAELRKEAEKNTAPEKCWYPGEVEKVMWGQDRASAKIEVRFFDQTKVTVDYHHPPTNPEVQSDSSSSIDASEFEVLVEVPGNPLAFRNVWRDNICYTRDSSTASVGDLVQGLYQNKDNWFAGRISHIRRAGKRAVCDILYEDGDFESQVPLEAKYVHLLEKGRVHPEWLIGLPFSRGRGRRKSVGLVSDAKSRGPIKITYKAKGESSNETRAYTAVVHSVMMMAVAQVPKLRRYVFPNLENNAHPISGESEAKSSSKESQPRDTTDESVQRIQDATARSAPLLSDTSSSSRAIKSETPTDGSGPPVRARKQRAALPVVDENFVLKGTVDAVMPRKTRPVRNRKQLISLSSEYKDDSDSDYGSDEDFEVVEQKPKKRAKARVQKENAAKASGKENNDTKVAQKRAARKVVPKPKDPPSSASVSQQGEGVNAKRKGRGKKKSPDHPEESSVISKKARLASMQFCEPRTIERTLPQNEARSRKELPPALGKALCKGLNSCDTHLAADLLTFITANHDLEPNAEIIRALIDLFLRGPMFGKGNFPDCQRMEIAQTYMSSSTEQNPHLMGRFVELAGANFWSKCLECLESKHYAIDGDETRATTFAVDRIAQSAHLKVCCADFFVRVLDHQLKACWGSSETLDRKVILSQPMIADMVNHRRGTKEAFECFAKQWISLWNTLGDYESRMSKVYPDQSGISQRSLSFLQEQSCQLIKALGKIVSRISWLHKFAEEETDSSVAYNLSNLISRNLTFDGPDAKLRLVLDLDNRVVPEMRIFLAEKVGVGERFNLLFSLLA